MRCLILKLIIPDTKLDFCYAVFRDGQCSNPSTTPTTKSACCCCTVILGQPMGWGTPCQSCPQPGTHEFLSLCPHGSGITHEGHGKLMQSFTVKGRLVYIFLDTD